MKAITEFMDKTSDGGWSMVDRVMVAETIGSFMPNLNLPPLSFKNVTFERCKVSPGTAWLGRNVYLNDVRFIEFDCGDALRIDLDTFAVNVTVSGKKFPKNFRVRARDSGLKQDVPVDVMRFDLSNYWGNVEIYGLPLSALRLDFTRHLFFDARAFYSADPTDVSLAWKSIAHTALSAPGSCAVFSLPKPKSKYYEGEMRDLRVLRALNVVQFDE